MEDRRTYLQEIILNNQIETSGKTTKPAKLSLRSANNLSIQNIIIRDSNCCCCKTSQLTSNNLHSLEYQLLV